MKKRMLSALLALCMAVTLLPTATFASDDPADAAAAVSADGKENEADALVSKNPAGTADDPADPVDMEASDDETDADDEPAEAAHTEHADHADSTEITGNMTLNDGDYYLSSNTKAMLNVNGNATLCFTRTCKTSLP